VAEEPLATAGDGSLDAGDTGDGPLGILQAVPAALQLTDGRSSFSLQALKLSLVGLDPAVGLRYAVVIGAPQPAAAAEFLDLHLGGGEILAGTGDAAVQSVHVALVGGDDRTHGRKLGAQPLQTAEFRAPVKAGAGFDVVAGLLPEPAEGCGVFASLELSAELRWRRLRRRSDV
jgi:hypothetical protein